METLAFAGEVMAGERTGVSRGNFGSMSECGGGEAGAWWPEDDAGMGQNPVFLTLPAQQLLPDACVGSGRSKRWVWGPCWPGDLCYPMVMSCHNPLLSAGISPVVPSEPGYPTCPLGPLPQQLTSLLSALHCCC